MSPEGYREITPEYPEDIKPGLEELLNAGTIDASADYVHNIHDPEARGKIEQAVREYTSAPQAEKVAARKKAGAAINKIIDAL